MTGRSNSRRDASTAAAGIDISTNGRPQAYHRSTAAPANSRLRAVVFAAFALIVLGAGAYLAGSVFLGQRGTTSVPGAMTMRISMDGFDPKVVNAKPGQTLTIDWWNTDAAIHLDGGVHTMVSDTANIHEAVAAESRKTITITAPTTPGDYDFWCDSCCGGKDNPQTVSYTHMTL